MKKVIDFVERINRNREAISTYMRQYALAHLDWQAKMKQYLDFVDLIRSRRQTAGAS
jgi:hypothetical protein